MQNRTDIYRLISLADISFNAKYYKGAREKYNAALKLVKQQIPDGTPLSEVDNDIRLYCAYLTYSAAYCDYTEHTLGKEHVASPEGIARTEATHAAAVEALKYIEDTSYIKESDNKKIQEIRRFENICIQNMAEQYCNHGYALYNNISIHPPIPDVDRIIDLLTKSRALYYKLVGLFSESENEDEQERHQKYENELDYSLAVAYELRADTYFDLYELTANTAEKQTYIEMACANYKTAIETTDNGGGYQQESLLNLYSSLLNSHHALHAVHRNSAATYLQPAINMANRLLDNFSSLTSSHLEELLAFVESYTAHQPHKLSSVTKPKTHVLTAIPTNLGNLSLNQLRSLIYLLQHPGTAFADIPGNTSVVQKKEIKKIKAEADISTAPAKKPKIHHEKPESKQPATSMPVANTASKKIARKIPRKSAYAINSQKHAVVIQQERVDRSSQPIPRYAYNYTELTSALNDSAFLGKVKTAIKSKSRTELTADLSNLGNVSLADPRRYFNTNEDIRSYAKTFMETFWKREENRTLVIEAHKKKVAIRQYSTLIHGENSRLPSTPQKMHGACISFFTVRIEGKVYCFVASSGKNNLDKYGLINALKQCSTLLKHEMPDLPEFLILDHYSDAYNDLVFNILKKLHDEKIVGEHHPEKACAEKFFMSMLTKIITAYPTSQVEAAINLRLYPFQKNTDYSNDSHIIGPEHNAAGFWGSEYFYKTLCCCESCSTNRDSMFVILESIRSQALQQNADMAAKKPYQTIRSTSPFHEKETDIIKKLRHSSNKIIAALAKKASSSNNNNNNNNNSSSSEDSDISRDTISPATVSTTSRPNTPSNSNIPHSSTLNNSNSSSLSLSLNKLSESNTSISLSKLSDSNSSIPDLTSGGQHTHHYQQREDHLAVKPATHYRERDYPHNNHNHSHDRNASGNSRNRDDSPRRYESQHPGSPRPSRENNRYESSTYYSKNRHGSWHRPTDYSDYRDRRDIRDNRGSRDNRDRYRR
jgi:hypothetical protein